METKETKETTETKEITLIKPRKTKSDGRVTINISFTTQEYELINYVDSCSDNFSQYIKDLIVADMNHQIKPSTLRHIETLIELGKLDVSFKLKK